MDQVYHRACALSGFPPMGGELVGTCGCPVHIRRLHIEKDKMAVVERVAHARSAVHNVVGRRDSVCPRGCIFHQPVLLQEETGSTSNQQGTSSTISLDFLKPKIMEKHE